MSSAHTPNYIHQNKWNNEWKFYKVVSFSVFFRKIMPYLKFWSAPWVSFQLRENKIDSVKMFELIAQSCSRIFPRSY